MQSRIGLLIIGDGRFDNLTKTISSAHKRLDGLFMTHHMHNDAPEIEGYAKLITNRYEGSGFTVFNHETRLGLSGSIQLAWQEMCKAPIDYVFHLEEDFVFLEDIDVEKMIDILETYNLTQLSLKRAPVNQAEEDAGGWIQQKPYLYKERGDYIEQNHLFTFNPCIYSRKLMEQGYPVGGGESELTTQIINRNPNAKFGILGSIDDPPLIKHIGSRRSENWKL